VSDLWIGIVVGVGVAIWCWVITREIRDPEPRGKPPDEIERGRL